jgi:hypothetical protein
MSAIAMTRGTVMPSKSLESWEGASGGSRDSRASA